MTSGARELFPTLLKSQKDIKRGEHNFDWLNSYADYQSLQGKPSTVFCVFLSKQSGELALAPEVISPETVDGFQKFERCLEAEKILQDLYRTDF